MSIGYMLEVVIKKTFAIQIFMLVLLSYLFTTCLAEGIFKKTINFLSANNDLEIDNILILSEPFQCHSDKALLCESVWSEVAEKETLPRTISFYKFLNSQNPTAELEKILNTTTSSLVVIANYVPSAEIQEILRSVSAKLLRRHQWLIIYPRNNADLLKVQEFVRSSSIISNKKLDLNSQVYILAGNITHGSIFEVYKTCKDVSMSTKPLKLFSALTKNKITNDAKQADVN